MAVDSKFFNIPFATSGDKATIPEGTQPSGAVSYTQGFGPDYERDPATDPLAKRVPRDETNEYLYQISNALKYLQWYGAPQYTSPADGGPANYPLSARVRYDAGSGMQAWVSLVATNTAVPGSDATKWALDEAFSLSASEATLAEALAGAIGTKIITPRRMASAVQRDAWTYAVAGGTDAALTATLNPAPSALQDGMRVSVKISTTNTGPSTLNVNGLGVSPIIARSGRPIAPGDLPAGAIVDFIRNGSSWMLAGLAYGDIPTTPTSDKTFYIRTDGDDNNSGIANTSGSAWKTIQGAVNNIARLFSTNAFQAILNISAGIYAGAIISRSPMRIVLAGVSGSPSSVTISSTVTGGGTLNCQYFSDVVVQDLTIENLDSSDGYGVISSAGAIVSLRRIRWGFSRSAAMIASANGQIDLQGAHTIGPSPGNKTAFIQAQNRSLIASPPSPNNFSLDVTTVFAVSNGFIFANSQSYIDLAAAIFTNKTNASGPRYRATISSTIFNNAGAADFFPGTTAGTISNGGAIY